MVWVLPWCCGFRCEQEVDECKSNPCLNGGYCSNLINKFVCVCDMSYAGDVCQTDVSDIYFYVALLLWQNLFQLLSYLILRLDDEPEVDWGGNDWVCACTCVRVLSNGWLIDRAIIQNTPQNFSGLLPQNDLCLKIILLNKRHLIKYSYVPAYMHIIKRTRCSRW